MKALREDNRTAGQPIAVAEPNRPPHAWHLYRGKNANFLPTRSSIEGPGGFASAFFHGLMPSEPFIDANTRVVAFGSCFAHNIARYLNGLGFNILNKSDKLAYVSQMGDGMVNTYTILQQFKWALDNVKPKEQTWHSKEGGAHEASERIRKRTQELFLNADVFIITLGLSEVWYDEPTGEVFWASVPKDQYDPTRHKFRTVTQAENKANIREMVEVIRRHRPDAAIVFTVSPVPLKATFRPISCIVANSVSKASIRSALDEVLQEMAGQAGKIFYFPAYEVVTQGFARPMKDDLRHPWIHVINVAMTVFERYYCRTERTDADVEAVVAHARGLDDALAAKEPGSDALADAIDMEIAYKRMGAPPEKLAQLDLAAQKHMQRRAAKQERHQRRAAKLEQRTAKKLERQQNRTARRKGREAGAAAASSTAR